MFEMTAEMQRAEVRVIEDIWLVAQCRRLTDDEEYEVRTRSERLARAIRLGPNYTEARR